jgi:arabinose-5-phosphate isomerase
MLLLLSYSGETKELQALCDYAKRRGIPMVAITSGQNSTLTKLADVTLLLPKAEEACPMGLAPTSSSTMTLALGDALAVALLTARGFTRDDFYAFHPSGSLGQQLRRIDSVMHHELPLIKPSTPVPQAIQTMTEYSFGCVGVTDDHGVLVGIITDGDVRRHALVDGFSHQKAEEVMTRQPHVIQPSALLVEAIAFFENQSISMLFVVDETNKPIGIIHFLDCLRAQAA